MEVVGDPTTVGGSSSKSVDGDEIGRDQVNHSPAQATIPVQEGVATMPLDPVDEPYEGQQFDSEEAAYAFYNGYASRAGFAIRRTNLRRSRTDNSRIGQPFVCNRAGFESDDRRRKTIKQTEKTKIGCEARIKLKKNVNFNQWDLVNFVKDHNHPITPREGRKDGLYDKFPVSS